MSNKEQASIPLHLFFFLATLFAFVGLNWYVNYDSIFEGFFGHLKLLLMLSPLLLLLLLLLTTSYSSWMILEHTPWGLGLLLVLLFFMISYHSYFRHQCFPLLT